MARGTIPVDLRNPGHVFGCLGFMEASEVLLGETAGAFDWSEESRTRFHIEAEGDENPIAVVLRFLGDATLLSEAPVGSDLATEKSGIPTRAAEDETYPFPEPASPATLPTLLEADGKRLVIDHWGDSTRRDSVKFWGGSRGYPGCGLARDALDLVREILSDAAGDPFSVAAPQSSGFRFDWRRDYVPIDVGFSPNKHTSVVMLGFPLVEVMAAIGLQNARPRRTSRRDKLKYAYGLVGTARPEPTCLPVNVHRIALGAVDLPFPQRFFHMRLDWPGKEGQARCIVDVTEETPT